MKYCHRSHFCRHQSPRNGQANGPEPSGQGVHGALQRRVSHHGVKGAGMRPEEDEEHQAQL